ncbi:transglutaminase-like domain-containing protein [Tsukamurella sp. M9C]|uniref:transglutaminase-like domain-containing protein n=1 Tax=Tsukamurella sp. M9C TaxID=2877520 RepID=UPI001CD00DCC|nr:transglutaminase-like domain-containing protein [Tsukamurella sp. M9C]MCA0157115.1 transglutaminase-like domain-containing protein [Tsukamurella sp. M9C]
MTIDYRLPGALTDLDAVPSGLLEGLGTEPVDICAPVHALIIQPGDAEARGFPEHRLAENQIRPAAEVIARLQGLDSRSLAEFREPLLRVVGTCRHFAVLACALLRYRGIAARVRCGFATYFEHDRAVDHWIVEYRVADNRRWVRLDPEILGQKVVGNPDDLADGQFLSGCEAWMAYRRGAIDASRFGVHGTANWGPAEIRGNVVKDLAALNKVEMLPWDEWGRMTEAYDGETGPDYDSLLDEIADACASEDATAVASIYEHADLRVPDELVR